MFPKMLFYTLSVFSILTFEMCVAKELPIVTCKRNVDNYPACLKLAIEKSYPRFLEGLPEYDVPTLNPMWYKYQKNVFHTGPISGKFTVRNVTVSGFNLMKFLAIRPFISDDDFHLELDIDLPKMSINGSCWAEGSLAGFNLNTSGHFYLNLEGVKSTYDLSGHVVNDTLTLEHFRSVPTVRVIKFRFADLFDGNEEFNNLLASIMNEFWPPIYRASLSLISDTWEKWLVGYGNTFFTKVPYSQVFPPS